jgi:hypothetical protein
MNEIFWPKDYIPGLTDNFVSSEVIVAGLSAGDSRFDMYHPLDGVVAAARKARSS